MKAFIQLVIANSKELLRDKMGLFWFLAFPLIFILLFGAIFSGNEDLSKFGVGMVREDNGPLGQALTQAFGKVPAFTIHQGNREQELALLKKGERSMVMVIPRDLSRQAASGQTSRVEVYYDPSKQMVSSVLLTTVDQVLNEAERRITLRPRLFSVKPVQIQAHKMRTIDYLLPGILGMALMQLGLFGSMRLVSLRERKILKRLGVTPLARSTLIASEVTVRLIMAIFQVITIVVVGQLVFDVKIVGAWWKILGLVLMGAATFVSLGYFLVSFARTEDSGQGIIQAVQFPMMFLSGIFFDVNFMPAFLRPVIKAIPLTYLGDALRQVMTGTPPYYPMRTDLLVLSAWLVVSLLLGIRFFQWE